MRAWVDTWRPFVEIEMLHAHDERGVNFMSSAVAGEVAGLRYTTGCQMFRHGAAQIEASGGLIAIERVYQGCTSMEFPDCNYVHRPGVIMITDYKQAFRGSHHYATCETVFLTRASLGLTDAEPLSPIMVALSTRAGKLLTAEIDQFFTAAKDGKPFDTAGLLAILRNEINESWQVGTSREEWWHGRRKLIHKYIETHLEDPNLGPLQICNLFNMSRATLYRMFEQDGGVRRFIQDRRLHSAMWDLAISGVKRGRLSQAAERWGFSSDANFNRAVKLVYGKPPGVLFKNSIQIEPASIDDQNSHLSAARSPISDWFHIDKMGAPSA